MSNVTDITLVGFDLGHGETALAVANAAKTTPPNFLDLPGASGRQHVTAVAEHPTRGVLVGEAALVPRDVTSLELGFKSRNLDRPTVKEPIRLFVTKIRQDLLENSLLPKGAIRWVFGAPSGWPTDLRTSYAALLKQIGLSDVEVVHESRAALLYARDSGEVPVKEGVLAGSVLIVDMGSSTTDFTSVVERRSKPIDQGNELGAHLIDKTILARVLDGHPQRDVLEDLLHRDRHERLRLELVCRRAKETFFKTDVSLFADNPAHSITQTFKVTTRESAIYVVVELSAADMNAVLDTPLPALEGQSWRAAFRRDLKTTMVRGGRRPDVVLLTGGASRMPFVLDIAREVFGADRVLRGHEPEAAIARGLALAGRTGVRAAGFRADVRSLTESGQISSLVSDRLPSLADKIGHAVAEGMTERHVIPAFRRWREGKIATLEQMASRISDSVRNELTRSSNPALARATAEWQNELRPELEQLTKPVCIRWHIPPTALTLPRVSMSDQEWNVPFSKLDAATEVYDNLALIIAGIVWTVLSVILVGTLLTGPFAIIIGLFWLAAGVLGGAEMAVEKAKTMNLPLPMRQLRSEEKMVTKLREGAKEQENQLARELAKQLVAGSGQKLTNAVSESIAKQLEKLAEDAELLIS
jgi:hypothetical protein